MRRARIDGHLTGESVALEKDFIDKEAKKDTSNPTFEGWDAKDQLVFE